MAETGRFVLAFVFLSASLPKLAARADFEEAVANYALLPSRNVCCPTTTSCANDCGSGQRRYFCQCSHFGGTDYCTGCQPDGNCYNGPC